VRAFLDRRIEGDWPYLWIDATYVKSRKAGKIVSKALIIVVAVNAEGMREVLGMAIGPSEAEPFWTGFLRSLTRCGLRGVKLVISDAHEGLKAAASKVLSATWQRRRVHFLRSALAHAGKGQRQMVLAAINTAFTQESFETALRHLDKGSAARHSRLDSVIDMVTVPQQRSLPRTAVQSCGTDRKVIVTV
jgi:putative transposase